MSQIRIDQRLGYGPLAGVKVLLSSAFFESKMSSLREYQYCKALSEAGAQVTLLTSTGSNVWRFNRAGISPTDPTLGDEDFVEAYGVELIRRRPWLRLSDFFVIWPPIDAIKRADIVHVIEFRQGFTAVTAAIAKLMGKTVIYDHEQRGDRDFTLAHRIDSVVRRVFIFAGSFFVDRTRHTVIQNGDFFKRIAWRVPPMTLAPLGGDEMRFGPDSTGGANKRAELGLRPADRVLVMSGKITDVKRPLDVVRAAVEAGWKIIVVGRIDKELRPAIEELGGGDAILIGWSDPAGLNQLYNAADAVIFTAFSVSYWEAAMTGVPVLAPRSRFAEFYIASDPQFHLFGTAEMFALEDEAIRPDFPLVPAVREALKSVPNNRDRAEGGGTRYSWAGKRAELVEYYRDVLGR